MSKEAGQFVFMTCRGGAESALKAEIARTQPAWNLAFSRPGFLTFKQAGDVAISDGDLSERSWTFAHAHGVSLGRLSGEQLAELVQQVWEMPGLKALAERGVPLDLHVWQRDAKPVGDDETIVTPLCREIEAALRNAAPEGAAIERTIPERRRASARGSWVIDVVVVEPGEWWIGYHHAVRRTQRWPGGAIPVRMPPESVSRAYMKIEEAIQWSELPLAAQEECIELGCAPGGACQALLNRGLFVTGIDPADVDESVLAHTRFRHLKKRGSDVRRHEFIGVRWLVADMNIAPEDTLAEVEAIVTSPQATIRGLVLTLKMSEWSVAARLPEFVERVRGWGYRDVRTRQLVTGGQEVCLVALRRRALRRLGKRRQGKSVKASSRSAKSEATLHRVDGPETSPPEPHF